MNINIFVFTGRLVADIDVRFTQQDMAIGRFIVAYSEKYKDIDKTYYFHCTMYDNKVAGIAEFINKGDLVLVEGSIHKNKKDEKEYVNVIVKNIQLLKKKMVQKNKNIIEIKAMPATNNKTEDPILFDDNYDF